MQSIHAPNTNVVQESFAKLMRTEKLNVYVFQNAQKKKILGERCAVITTRPGKRLRVVSYAMSLHRGFG
ncbi:hypothetical protein TNCT_689571 [Trichonephila clavata]|uniref:Uncharacterized protein n=1 Tax=Trichonephila clavata TaxID=2740835 RepID=A0A8X6GTP2_TRICU|nr:hypothetical protein TNCT_689571 [Trichonephila clavata]